MWEFLICHSCSTIFLVGPISQAKKLIDRSNLVGTLIKIICIVVFLVSVAFVFCAIFWVSIVVCLGRKRALCWGSEDARIRGNKRREREEEREREREREREWERERERERVSEWVCERDRESVCVGESEWVRVREWQRENQVRCLSIISVETTSGSSSLLHSWVCGSCYVSCAVFTSKINHYLAVCFL